MKKTVIILSLLLAFVLLVACGEKSNSEDSASQSGFYFNIKSEEITGITLQDCHKAGYKTFGNENQEYMVWFANRLNKLEYCKVEKISKEQVDLEKDKIPNGGRWMVKVSTMIPDGEHNYKSETKTCYFYEDSFEVKHSDGSKTLYTLTDESVPVLQEIVSLLSA